MKPDATVIDSTSAENVSIDERLNGISHTDETPTKPGRRKKWTREYRYKFFAFIIIALIQIFVNYDNGVVPVILDTIQKPYNFKSTELGAMGALPHLGYFFLSPLLSHILTNYSSKTSLIISIFFNIVALGAFGLSVNKYMFFVAKFCIGVTQALYFTYYPLWVDTFAPANHRNLWMSIIQGGIIIGITIGYIMTSVFLYVGKYGWRYSIMTQAIGLGITVALFWMVPKQYIEFDPSKDDIVNFDSCTCDRRINQSTTSMETKYVNDETCLDDKSHHRNNFNVKRCHSLEIVIPPVNHPTQQKEVSRVYSNLDSSVTNSENPKCSKCFLNNAKQYRGSAKVKNMSTIRKFVVLFKNIVFMLSCLIISSINFVIFGAQFWMTKIVVSHFNIGERKVFLIFSYIFMTSQLTGLLFGSYLTDKIVYYYPQKPLYLDFALIGWISIVCLAGIGMILKKTRMALFIGNLVVFFYSAPLTSIVFLRALNGVDHGLKPTAASITMININILGFIGGTLVPGIAVDLYKNDLAAVYIIYIPSFITLASLIAICLTNRRRASAGTIDHGSRYKIDMSQ